MHAFTTLVALFATAMTVSALPPLLDTLSTTDFLLPPLSGGNNDGNNGGDNRDDDRDNDDNSPDCGGQKAMCCSGTYGGEGLVVDNCVTYTDKRGVCDVDSNIYCCGTCIELLGACIGCSRTY